MREKSPREHKAPGAPAARADCAELRAWLEAAHSKYHRHEFLHDDPLQFAHRYADPIDREVVAFFSAGFAWGNVRAIHASIERLLRRLGDRPATTLANANGIAEVRPLMRGLVHRRIHAGDLAYLGALLGECIRRHGSLGGLWRAVDDPDEATTHAAAQRFLVALSALPITAPRHRGRALSGELLASNVGLSPFGFAPSGAGSPLKRLHLFLRWMVRPSDGVDLGLWSHVVPSRLVVPLDVHMLRTAQQLGLTARRDASLRTALEITRGFAAIAPHDPCRYDFAIIRAARAAQAEVLP